MFRTLFLGRSVTILHLKGCKVVVFLSDCHAHVANFEVKIKTSYVLRNPPYRINHLQFDFLKNNATTSQK